MTGDERERRIELEVEVPGTPEEVWEAIATGPGLSAWMHPAEVEEREGGRFAYDMGPGMKGSGRVTGWDPPRRFAQSEEWSADAGSALLATEWLIEAQAGGTCVVRMVMSGFGDGSEWDEEIGGIDEGMGAALESLRLYMTHFAGQRGAWIRAFGNRPGRRAERWAALSGALGLTGAAPGRRVATSGDGVPALAGVVEDLIDKHWHSGVLLRIDDPAPGLAHVLVFGERGWATIQACIYGDAAAAIAAQAEPAWREWMEERFSTAAA
jgi:uncharacterized protein YndB with AHSA1/START domain